MLWQPSRAGALGNPWAGARVLCAQNLGEWGRSYAVAPPPHGHSFGGSALPRPPSRAPPSRPFGFESPARSPAGGGEGAAGGGGGAGGQRERDKQLPTWLLLLPPPILQYGFCRPRAARRAGFACSPDSGWNLAPRPIYRRVLSSRLAAVAVASGRPRARATYLSFGHGGGRGRRR